MSLYGRKYKESQKNRNKYRFAIVQLCYMDMLCNIYTPQKVIFLINKNAFFLKKNLIHNARQNNYTDMPSSLSKIFVLNLQT